jgi:hypothetical protein
MAHTTPTSGGAGIGGSVSTGNPGETTPENEIKEQGTGGPSAGGRGEKTDKADQPGQGEAPAEAGPDVAGPL